MVKGEYYQIGEVSKITGISKDTLHFYTKTGLLIPDYIDSENQYRYYSLWNLWQLDIITTCRKLSIPLEKVKQILSFRDNTKIVELLMEYREEALRLSNYYQQVAEDILWYGEENRNIISRKAPMVIEKKWFDSETVIVGNLKRNEKSYHTNLQEVVKDELKNAPSIRRKYGYVLDAEKINAGEFAKCREYLKIEGGNYENIPAENLYTLPCGMYVVFNLHIQNERADFSPLIKWLQEHGETIDAILTEELGLQLFEYISDYYCEVKVHLKRKNA